MMAEHTEDVEELKDFFLGLNTLFGHSLRAFQNKDTIAAEYCKAKLENSISIVVAMTRALSENVYTNDTSTSIPSSRNNNLAMLLQDLVVAMEGELEKLSQVAESCPELNTTINVCSTLTSTGGRPAFKLAKEQIEQLWDTGMNWKEIANFLGVSARTLHRKRIEYGIEQNFSEISDADLDKQVQEVLQLTPYSGESYIRGSLQGRNIHVQRARIRRSFQQVDQIGRSIRRRYAICRRVYNVHGPNYLWHIDLSYMAV